MTTRAEQKRHSRNRILEAASRRLRAEGMSGAGIGAVMADAGLTHGAFYAHFKDKDELAREALVHALHRNRPAWMGERRQETWRQRLTRLAQRYLTPAHRRRLSDGCALAALCSEAARGDVAFKKTFEQELRKSLLAVCDADFDRVDDRRAEEALAFMSLIIGSITLSRAVHSDDLSNRLLKAGVAATPTLTHREAPRHDR